MMYRTIWLIRALVYSLSSMSVFSLRPVREEFFKQLEAAGVGSLGLVGLMGVLLGSVIISQSVNIVGVAGEVPVKLLDWVLFGEAGALVVGFLIAARIAPTMGASLALMRFRGELNHLVVIGISVADYLVVPRVVALLAVGVLLSVYFMACALLGGMLIASFLQNFSFLHQLERFFELASPLGMMLALLKGSLFAGVVALVSCYSGLVVERNAKKLHEAGSEALTGSILALCLLDAVLLSSALAVGAD